MYIDIYMYIYICICMYLYIFIKYDLINKLESNQNPHRINFSKQDAINKLVSNFITFVLSSVD